jgi:hypothetical protein
MPSVKADLYDVLEVHYMLNLAKAFNYQTALSLRSSFQYMALTMLQPPGELQLLST